MIRNRERQSRDDYVRECLAGNIHTHPETVRSKEDAARRGLELFEQLPTGCASALHQKIEFLSRKKFLHLIGQVLHAPITGEKHECAPVCLLDKVRDPMLERFFVTCIAWIWHFLHDEHFHLGAKIERTPEEQGRGFAGADALPKIGKIRTPN